MAKLGDQEMTKPEKVALLKTQALIHAESMYHYILVGRATGITDETLKKYRDEDSQFSQLLEQARTRFLNKKMKVAKPEFLLERLEPDLFKQRTEQELNHNGEVSFVNDVPRPATN